MIKKNELLVLAGAAAGGAFGIFAFGWLTRQGLYALILPGGLAGLGAGVFRSHSIPACLGCSLLALAAGLGAEWSVFPFAVDESLGYFLANLSQLRPITLAMIAIGTFLGFWVPFPRRTDGPTA